MTVQGDVQFKGSRSEFVAGGLMFELDAEETKTKSDEPNKHEENSVEEVAVKPNHKSVISLSGAANSEPASETSSIAPEGEDTLTSSDAVLIKARTPRKLIEDEKRAKGRIAWPVWRAYFIVSLA
jgi:hypothetical protein